MRSSCSGVGATSSSPSTWRRTVAAPTKEAMLGETPCRARYASPSPRVVHGAPAGPVRAVRAFWWAPEAPPLGAHLRAQGAKRATLAEDLQGDALADVALGPPVPEQAGLLAHHVDKAGRHGQAPGVDLHLRPAGAAGVTLGRRR